METFLDLLRVAGIIFVAWVISWLLERFILEKKW
jgi:hypothetical protein